MESNLKKLILFLCFIPLLAFATGKNELANDALSLTAAIPDEFPPYYTIDDEGRSIGFAIDVLNEVAAIANIEINYQKEKTWHSVHQSMQNNKADIIPNLGISFRRQKVYDFTTPIETFPISLFVRDSSTHIKKMSDLSGYKVAVVQNNVAVPIMQARPDIDVIVYEHSKDALFALLSSEVDALVYPKTVLIGLARSIGVLDQIKIVGETILEVRRGIAINKGKPEVLNRLNLALIDFLPSEKYKAIYIKWFGITKPYWNANRVAWLVGVLFVLFIVIVSIWRYFILSKLNKSLLQNIENRKKAEALLKSSEAGMRGLINALPDLVWLKNKEGVYLACNPKFEKLYGHKEAEILGKTDYDFVSKEIADFFRKNDNAAKKLGRPRINEEELKFADDGHKEWTETIKAPVYGDDGDFIGVLGIGRDITERKQAEEKILYQAHFDSLTDLPNRFLALDRLEFLIGEAKRNEELIALVFLDLDNFKKVNDSFGHSAGDVLLMETAKRLKSLVRENDTVGRLGGDEFLIILGGLKDLNQVNVIAENVLNSFRLPFIVEKKELMLTFSIGISVYPNDGGTSSDLLRKSDSAMYQSKSDGRNTYTFFTEAMNQSLTRRLELEAQLHGALERGEFTVYYQPKINFEDDKMMGAEALLRWNNPLLGNVSPEEFIPVAEQTGVILSIGRYVLEQSLIVTEKWQREFKQEFNMAVNFSPRQFRDESLFSYIDDLMEKHHIQGKDFEVEITEGLLMSGDNSINSTLLNLNAKGIHIAMDDFGTGYSSLSYLRQYPFDVLKIDRSFINDITTDSNDKELVNAAIAMSHGLKLKVVAEGVETQEQLELLKEMGCDIGQGYLFSKPVPENEFVKLFGKY